MEDRNNLIRFFITHNVGKCSNTTMAKVRSYIEKYNNKINIEDAIAYGICQEHTQAQNRHFNWN